MDTFWSILTTGLPEDFHRNTNGKKNRVFVGLKPYFEAPVSNLFSIIKNTKTKDLCKSTKNLPINDKLILNY